MLNVRTTLSLVLIGAGSAMLLAAVQQVTAGRIADNRHAQAMTLAADLLGTTPPVGLSLDHSVTGDCREWLILRLSEPGYAGPIDALAVWRPAPARLSLRVTGHRETPGIGDFIDHQRNPWMTHQDRATEPAWQQVSGVSGATITARAIKQLARQAFSTAEVHCG